MLSHPQDTVLLSPRYHHGPQPVLLHSALSLKRTQHSGQPSGYGIVLSCGRIKLLLGHGLVRQDSKMVGD